MCCIHGGNVTFDYSEQHVNLVIKVLPNMNSNAANIETVVVLPQQGLSTDLTVLITLNLQTQVESGHQS